jgi:linoleoyl-CoA desaturase
MAVKVIFFLSGFVGSYFMIYLSGESVLLSIMSWLLMGFFTAFVGFNISHDAVHGSLSGNKLLNRILGYTFNLAGTNKYMWKILHNVIHHTYTNIPGFDEDLEPGGLIRLSTENKLKKSINTSIGMRTCFIPLLLFPGYLKRILKHFLEKNWAIMKTKAIL